MQAFGPFVDGYHDVADQLAQHLRNRANQAFAREVAEKAALHSVADFEARRQRVKQHLPARWRSITRKRRRCLT